MTREIPASAGGVVIETFVPWKMVRRGVRKRIVTPLGEPEAFAGEASSDAGAEDPPLLRALWLSKLLGWFPERWDVQIERNLDPRD